MKKEEVKNGLDAVKFADLNIRSSLPVHFTLILPWIDYESYVGLGKRKRIPGFD